MKHFLIAIAGLVVAPFAMAQPGLHYTIAPDTTDWNGFLVTLTIEGELDKKTNYYQFAATAPGTYQTMNMGRYVTDFVVIDDRHRQRRMRQAGMNRWEIRKANKIRQIQYRIAETFDTPVQEDPIYPMAGSSLEPNHALISPHALIGYPKGMQQAPVTVTLDMPEDWTAATALELIDGRYQARNYDHLVDSPILTGMLTGADTSIADTQVEVYAYSEHGLISADTLLGSMHNMLAAAKDFLITLPVNRYTFLFHFEENPPEPQGAWEHQQSSEYVYPEQKPDADYLAEVRDVAAHEFFHIVTPLNLHSEKIETFNFVEPDPSLHLWLYEGVTEWATQALQVRGGLLTADEYLSVLTQQYLVDQYYFDPSWSLKKLAMESYSPEGQEQYGNIYYKGALIGALLDLKLLKLSGGVRGLREVLLDLIEEYGVGKPISEESFIQDFVAATYPEIQGFFDAYVLNAEPLPMAEYFGYVGVDWHAPKPAAEGERADMPSMSWLETPNEEQEALRKAWLSNLPRY